MTHKNPVVLLLFCLSMSTVWSQESNNLTGKPKTLTQCWDYLDKIFDDTSKYTFKTLPEDISTGRLHHGFGMWIRNNWGLWKNSDLKKSLLDSGFVHPDDMSAIILKSYHRHLNGLPLNIKEEAIKYRTFWQTAPQDGFSAPDLKRDHDSFTSVEELMKYFPIGDTIVVSVFAAFKKNYASSLRGIAIVKAHSTEKLIVRLISLEQKSRHKPDRQIGDEYEVSPINCSLIPPSNWKINGR
ncbi:MAG: hypothetical protein KF803_12330 [Cyclobacteriaceae bacterium]|nr:hypothetical protein [Cyclobacteriaceae bacterium]